MTSFIHLCPFYLFIFILIIIPQEPPSEMLESGKYVEPSSRDISSTNWCGKCHSHRPKRAHHCRYCQRFASSCSLQQN